MAQRAPDRRLAKALAALADVADDLDRLDAVRQAREAVERLELQTVRQAREAGLTWTQIGAVYGVSKQAAQQRFSDVSRARARKRPAEPAGGPPPASVPAAGVTRPDGGGRAPGP